MTIRFIKNYKKYSVGQVATLPTKQEYTLVREGVAEPVQKDITIINRGAIASITGTTNETQIIPTIYIPANSIGLNGKLVIEPYFTSSATTNNRTMSVKIGPTLGSSTTVWTRTRNIATSIAEIPQIVLMNRGVMNSQIFVTAANGSFGVSNGATNPSTTSIDFSIDQNIYITGQLAVGSETVALQSISVYVMQ